MDQTTSSQNSSRLTNTSVLDPVAVKPMGTDRREMVMWGLACALFSIFVFGVATLQYYRKVSSSPAAKRKRKQKQEKRKRAREEKSITEVSRDIIPAIDFLDALKRKRKKGLLSIEFKALNRLQSDNSCEIALLPENRKKNYYPEVLPFDHCRVILESLPAEEDSSGSSDYINASYIDAYNKPKAYIAAQGPSRHTINDFWRMVWQENVYCIVMATNVFEHARQQCEKYWHNAHGRYGKIDVWLDDTDILADFNVRTFRVTKEGSEEERVIKQYQFANWSDHDCPNPSSVLEYRRRIKAYIRNKGGPIVVHCGAGAGRTGTFIAIDAMLDRVSIEKTVDIFNYVLYLRNSRQSMVRNLAQYEFIYDTVAMYLQCGITVITARELPAVVQKLAIKDQQTRLNGFEREFKTLQTVVPKLTVGECAGGHRAENRRKSRDIMLQPPERARPYLITHDSNDSTDYINAVYVDGYRNTNAYIVTQWPLKGTVNDIWRLVYDYNIPTLVLLNDGPCSRGYPRFWPTKEGVEVPYGPLTIELVSIEDEKHIVSRVFRVRKHVKYKDLNTHLMEAGEITTLVSLQTMSQDTGEAAKTVKLFQLKCWPNGHKVPTSSSALIELLTKVEDWQMNNCRGRIPTCVLSRNGVSRCGVYCAVSIAWEKLKSEGEVDIFRAVKTIKMNRPELVENLVEYIYCYTFMVILLEILNTTHPNLIPRREISEEESWDNREKPLTKPERAAKGAQSRHPIVINDTVHVPDVDPYPAFVSSAPSSACVPSVLLPAKNLSRSSSTASSSSSVEGRSGWRDHVKNRKIQPGFMNPAFYYDGQNKIDSIQLEPIRPIHELPTTSPENLQHDIPNKALPKYLVQYSVTKEGVFDSKESADSGISKGSMVHQSSNEENRDDCYSSPISDKFSVNQIDLMQGRSALDASTRRRIFHQESVKNRAKAIVHLLDESHAQTAENSPMVIVHRTNSGNEHLRSKSPGDLNNGDKLIDNEGDKSSRSSPFVVIGSPERPRSVSALSGNSSYFIIQRSDEEESLPACGELNTDESTAVVDNVDANANVKEINYRKSATGPIVEFGDYQSFENRTTTAENGNESMQELQHAQWERKKRDIDQNIDTTRRSNIFRNSNSIDRPVKYQRYLNSPEQETYGYGSTATNPSYFHQTESANDKEKTVIWKF